MAAFIDLAYYTDTYKGVAIPAASFYRFADRATSIVEFQTFERAGVIITAATDTVLIDKIKMATCAAADKLYYLDQKSSLSAVTVASERVGDHSVNYAVSGDASLTTGGVVSNAIREYLAFTGLLFRGFE